MNKECLNQGHEYDTPKDFFKKESHKVFCERCKEHITIWINKK